MPDEQDWSAIEVFADRLQAAGDPRGELLALELAAERATCSEEARRLNREAQRVRDAHHELVWPAALARTDTAMRAGFVVSMHGKELADPSIPIELLLSARDLSVGRQRLEACVPRLEEACSRGLRLEGVGHWLYDADPPTDLDRLRGFIELDGRAPTLEWIAFADRVIAPRVLTGLAKLVSCSFGAPLSEAELRSLAPLPLQRLRLQGPHSTEVLVELFGDTLESLELRDCIAPLTPLSRSPTLRSLTLMGANTTELISELHELTQLQSVHLPRLDPPDLRDLSALRLRSLSCSVMPAKLAARLPQLAELEALSIHEVEGGPLDLSPLAELPRLRRLVVPGELIGSLTLPASFEWLGVSDATRPVPIDGEVAELGVFHCDLRWLPPSLLERVRTLRYYWNDPEHDHVLAELPRLAPGIERLELDCSRGDWDWPDAPAILGALPQLRWLDWPSKDLQQLAERARMLPDLCLLKEDWPRLR